MTRCSQLHAAAVLAVVLIQSSPANADPAQCEENISASGNFFTGKTYESYEVLPNMAPAEAFNNAYSYLAKNGWKIVRADKDSGAISASEDANYSTGDPAPLNLLVEPDGKTGSKVSATLTTGRGQMTLRADFICGILSKVGSPR